MVEVVGLRKSFGETTVLEGVDLAADAGTVLGLLGPNGAGKTTIVRILATLLRPDGGAVRIGGHDVATEPAAVRPLISLTGQYAAVDDRQTGFENLVMVGRLWHLSRREARRRAADLLDRFDLAAAANRRVETYSGGMRRRLDVAMGLVAATPVVFLDEPTTGLDPTSRATTWDVVRDLVAGGTTVVLTTQYLEEADRLADQIVLIDAGRVAASGRAADLKRHVGGTRLDLRFTTTNTAAAAAATLVDHGAQVASDDTCVGIPSDGSAGQVRHVLNTLADARIDVAAVAQHEPTLDDVFFALTGSGAR